MPLVKLRLSDEAFSNLNKMAHDYYYIRIKASTQGLGHFFDILSTLEYEDNRPDYLKEWKPLGYNIWFVPEYCNYTRERLISLQDYALMNFSRLALQYDILRVSIRPNQSITTKKFKEHHPNIIHFKRHQTPTMLSSAILEAIGTDLLLPVDPIPIKTWYTLKPRIKSREVYW